MIAWQQLAMAVLAAMLPSFTHPPSSGRSRLTKPSSLGAGAIELGQGGRFVGGVVQHLG
jgi:hypothetical protein